MKNDRCLRLLMLMNITYKKNGILSASASEAGGGGDVGGESSFLSKLWTCMFAKSLL
jgi:hypothetical protein